MAEPFWAAPLEALYAELGSSAEGLDTETAACRLREVGPNRLREREQAGAWRVLLRQFTSPIVLILLFAAGLSLFVGDATDAGLILVIVLASGLLGFWQEHSANRAVAALLALVTIKARVRRDGQLIEIGAEAVVPGDVVELEAGDAVPGDSRLIEANHLFLDEAALTGETFPAEKSPGLAPAGAPIARRENALFMGTHVVSGRALALVVATGAATELGRVSGRLRREKPETEFERGITRFGTMLAEVTLMLVLAIFAINVALDRPMLEAFLFALALAVGLTPQLLPAIIGINLAKGAQRMAERRVIVKRLAAIENFGSMDLLCSDKTGTLTEGVIRLGAAIDAEGREAERVREWAALNAAFESGYLNPIDSALRAERPASAERTTKLAELPYDFVRKRLSLLLALDGRHVLVTKGALANVLAVCTTIAGPDGTPEPLEPRRAEIEARFEAISCRGLRVLGVATRDRGAVTTLEMEDEREMKFEGFLCFDDPLKPGIRATIARLEALGVRLAVITGDNRHIARHLAEQVGLDGHVLTGEALARMSEPALVAAMAQVRVFAEIEPNQKERLIFAARKAGHVVGYMGDGINDGPALHAADVGLSVDQAVDVAKEAADLVLLEKDLDVLVEGVRQGRVTFANTLKYVFMATSANFGNMFSMAGASLFLPFLPLLPTQILLTNILTDLPEMTIALDRVDPEWISAPRRWDLGFIRDFMVLFGLVSSVFDYVTFGVLWWVLQADASHFRTGWFTESVLSACLIVLVIRTRRRFVDSRPAWQLVAATLGVSAAVVALPYTPVGALFQFQPLPAVLWVVIGAIVVAYVLLAELAKRVFYRAHPP